MPEVCNRLYTRNRLLGLLPAADFAALQPHLEPVELRPQQVLADYDTPVRYVHFPEEGIASMVIASPDGHVAEVAMVGREGLVGLPVVLATERAAAKVFVQMGGHGWRVGARELQALFGQNPVLHQLLLRYSHTVFMQMAYTALSNAAHTVEQRLARWLLMAHDRIDGDEVTFTHDFLALMLNVRRPSVTTTLHVLEGEGLIRATRGRITIRNREGLVSLAHAAYGVPEAEYERAFGAVDAEKAA